MNFIEPRLVTSLLLDNGELVKTTKFKNPRYIGEPLNVLKIFNTKAIDELAILDISVTKHNDTPNFNLLKSIATECFFPLSYGGGISSVEIATEIIKTGYEKVIISSHQENLDLIKTISDRIGSSSTVVCLDVKKNWLGKYEIFTQNGLKPLKQPLETWIKKLEESGVGEVIIQSINNDGTMNGYDLNLITEVSKYTTIPIIALGGAGKMEDFVKAINSGANACAAGSKFIYQGPHQAVLVNYPNRKEIKENLYGKV